MPAMVHMEATGDQLHIFMIFASVFGLLILFFCQGSYGLVTDYKGNKYNLFELRNIWTNPQVFKKFRLNQINCGEARLIKPALVKAATNYQIKALLLSHLNLSECWSRNTNAAFIARLRNGGVSKSTVLRTRKQKYTGKPKTKFTVHIPEKMLNRSVLGKINNVPLSSPKSMAMGDEAANAHRLIISVTFSEGEDVTLFTDSLRLIKGSSSIPLEEAESQQALLRNLNHFLKDARRRAEIKGIQMVPSMLSSGEKTTTIHSPIKEQSLFSMEEYAGAESLGDKFISKVGSNTSEELSEDVESLNSAMAATDLNITEMAKIKK